MEGDPLRRAARGRAPLARAPAGRSVDGRARGHRVRPRLHAAALPERRGATRHPSRGGLPLRQRLGAREAGFPEAARPVLDPRRRLRERRKLPLRVRRERVREARRRAREPQPPPRPLRVLRSPGAHAGEPERAPRKLRIPRPDRGARVGEGQHRGLRGRSRERHDLRRVGGRRLGEHPPRIAARPRALPQGDRGVGRRARRRSHGAPDAP